MRKFIFTFIALLLGLVLMACGRKEKQVEYAEPCEVDIIDDTIVEGDDTIYVNIYVVEGDTISVDTIR